MSDEIKRYPPTPRRLERLRRLGVSPASSAVTALAVLLGGTGLLLLSGSWLRRWLQATLAQDLQHGALEPVRLAGLLARQLGGAGLVVIAVSVVAMGLAAVAQMAQGTILQHSSKQMYLPMSTDGGPRRRGASGVMPLPLLIGLGAAVWLIGGWLRGLATGVGWGDQPVAVLGARWLAVLGAVALLHAVTVRMRTLNRAQMSHREMVEEKRETDGSWLKRRRTNEWLRRRR